jgi:GTP cyclohydrolase I
VDSLYEITTKIGKKVSCTGDHPFFVIGKGWVEASKLNPGDNVYVLRNAKGYITGSGIMLTIGTDLAYFLGALASDGSIWRNSVRLEVNERWFAEKFVSSIKGAFGIDAQIEEISKPSGFLGKDITQYRVRVVNGLLVNVVDELFGCRKKTKNFNIPKVAFNNYEMFRSFLEGYVDGDGCVYSKESSVNTDRITQYIRIITSNKGFADELGSIFDTPVKPHANSCYIIGIPLFILGLEKRQVFKDRFIEKFDSKFKNASLVTVDLNREVDTVVSVDYKPKGGKKRYAVYNLEIEDNHTYLANDIWVHNCEHHIIPFIGRAHIGYIPANGQIAGLSKFARVVDYFSARLQVQEKLTAQIADYLNGVLEPQGLIVVMEAEHECMSCRGVKKAGATTITSAIRGKIDKAEFLQLLKLER